MNDQDHQDLVTLNRLDELLIPCKMNQKVQLAAITRATARRLHSPQIVQEEIVQQIRIERIKQAQDEESWISNLKMYRTKDAFTITSMDEKSCALPHRTTRSIIMGCCSIVPDRPQRQKIAQSWFEW